jgi:hypothetical protein
MWKQFNLNTVTILQTENTGQYPIKALVKGKLIGGKRWKRTWIYLNKDEHRHIKLKEF